MAEPFLGQISIMSFAFAPRGWAQCNGQLLSIAQNTALFSILGTTYGGNGISTFALPDLRGRTPLFSGSGYVLGEVTGEETHILTQAEMPAHTHQVVASSAAAADQPSPAGALWAGSSHAAYSSSASDSIMHAAALGTTGNSFPHENRSPYLVVSFCIAMSGVFPSRN
jgi:microcystin-dependent protein